ncbi:TetR-like C-terminal domain-containing protein [Pseudonocardia humida]|uniref:TetR/AcrR family transcriptional regulator C-terminal ligand-binding domain-containing protein n=1 Tax=Pseudonocardia humida TaxID=2800819 RepID=A0ABT1A0C2_9PSEU|nr:TetR-like C-terminal domain-containing protein [Pseudonocardia humida]MCO1656388.1 TetR/AcrR family transcriptional regulator C-terminal ligand-binding domain-containing protein [Pseudonocardia humida]
MTAPEPVLAARPGGRSARIRAAVHRAVVQLVAEDPADGLTVPIVAARAGVHATTVYRRWRTVGELLSDVATSRFSGEIVVPDTGSLRGDLRRWAADVATDLADPDVLALMRAALGAGGQQGACACRGDRERQLAAMIERERARRSGPVPSVERAADVLLGPLYYRAIFANAPGSPEWARDLVDILLPGPVDPTDDGARSRA